MSTFARMKAKRTLLGILLLVCCLSMTAQRRLVAVDIDRLTPIADVSVTMNGGVCVSDSTGHFEVPDTCKLLFLSHMSYESRLVKLSELSRDTVFLVPTSLNISELVVFGVGPGDEKIERLNRSLRLSKEDAQLMQANPNGNLFGLVKYLIPKKWLKSRKARLREQLKKNLDTY